MHELMESMTPDIDKSINGCGLYIDLGQLAHYVSHETLHKHTVDQFLTLLVLTPYC